MQVWMVLATVAFGLAAQGKTERPSILFILADDLGKEWLSCYGSEGHRTPNLDRLAAGGVRFENVYATPLCTPTRHEMLTGRYPFRTGWTVHHDSPRWGGQHFDWNREITFARVLKSAGYVTGIAGKWQINDLREQRDALKHHGFDEHCVWPGFEADNPPSAERYDNPYIQRNGDRRTHKDAFGPDVFAEFVIDFMTRHKDEPFLIYYPMVLTHTPFTTTPSNRNTEAKGLALFPGMVDYADHLVGRLIRTLEELRIRDRTIVFFAADNGTVGGVKCRARGLVVDGGKGTMRDTGICVPFMVNCPDMVPGGRVSDELIDFTDVFPTLVELARAGLPPGVTIDGRSFAGVLKGTVGAAPRRDWIFSQLGKHRVVRDKRFKLHEDGRFYDLSRDPLEEKTLIGSDAAGAAAARAKLTAVMKSLPDDAKLPFEPRSHGSTGKSAAPQREGAEKPVRSQEVHQ